MSYFSMFSCFTFTPFGDVTCMAVYVCALSPNKKFKTHLVVKVKKLLYYWW